MIGKIAALLVMRKTIPPSNLLFRQLLAGVAATLALTLTAVMLFGVLLLGGVYWGYRFLVENGLEMQAAMASVGFVVLLLVMALAAGAVISARRIRDIPKRLISMEAPLTYRASSIANAFLDGLFTRPKPRC